MTDFNTTQSEARIEYFRNELAGLGLSEKESTIYLFLLLKGTPLGGTKIALGTMVHRQHVYNALLSLTERGLIEKVVYGKQFRYRASSPRELEKIERRRYLNVGLLTDELSKLSPLRHDQDFEVLVGERAIQQHQMDFVREAQEGETQHIIGGSADAFISLMGDLYSEMLEIQEKKNFVTYYIGNKSEDEQLTPYRASRVSFHAKLLPDIPNGFLQFTVRRNTVEFYSLTGSPPILYVIKSERVANNFRAFFEMFWMMAGDRMNSVNDSL